MKLIQSLFSVFIILIIASCANIVSPTGGPKDTTPPKLVKAHPDTFATHFNTDQIRIDFDEYIQLKDPMGQVIISPLLEKQPDIKVSKKSVIIKFKEKLKDSTTYNINFGSSISDVHEDNIKEGFQYVFSTGPYVDSLSLRGKCQYANDLHTEKGVLIMLYKSFDDSVPSLRKPDYFTKCDSFGNYKINNIREGTYKMFALKDLNSNYRFDQPGEAIGFKDSTIHINGNDTANFNVFVEPTSKQYIVKQYCEEFGKLFMVFNKPTENLEFHFLNNQHNDTSKAFFEYSKAKDSVIYWFTSYPQDSMKMIVSDNGKPIDTLAVYIKPKDFKMKSNKNYKFSLAIHSSPSLGALSPEADWQLVFSHPVNQFDSTKISLREDSVLIGGFKVSDLDSTLRKLNISYKWKENSTYILSFSRGTFKDIFGVINDTTLNFGIKIKSARDYGNLHLKFKAPDIGSNYILQLMNDKDELIQQNIVRGDTAIDYNFLDPSKYKLKLIFDANNNGKWDTGDYYKHIQPEKVTYCKEIFNVRANWDVDADWTVKE
jgi:uncharacterized protein (DUF2141 family)